MIISNLFFCLTLLFFSLLITPATISAAPILTELHPAPATGQPEWIELHNPDLEPVDLTGWQLWDELSTPSLLLTLSTILAPQETRVFELPSAKLNNSADGITLRNPTGQTIDSTSYTNSEPTLSWLRIAQNWQLGTATPGSFQSTAPSPTPQPSPTPPASNSPTPTPTPHPTLVPTPQPSPTPTAHYSLKLTELYPCPPTGEQEYVTITNTGTSRLDLGQLLIRDEQHNTRTASGLLAPATTTTLSWATAMLNNAGDTVSILSNTNQVLDSAQYTACQTGQVLTFSNNNWQSSSSQAPTPTPANNTVPTPSATPLASADSEPAATPSAHSQNKPPRIPLDHPILNTPTAPKASDKTPTLPTANSLTYAHKTIHPAAVASAILGSVLLSLGGGTLYVTARPVPTHPP